MEFLDVGKLAEKLQKKPEIIDELLKTGSGPAIERPSLCFPKKLQIEVKSESCIYSQQKQQFFLKTPAPCPKDP